MSLSTKLSRLQLKVLIQRTPPTPLIARLKKNLLANSLRKTSLFKSFKPAEREPLRHKRIILRRTLSFVMKSPH